MSFTPALVANRRWSVGGTALDEVMGPPQSSPVVGAEVSRGAVSTPLVVPLPAGVQVGDALFVMLASVTSPTTPTGWTLATSVSTTGISGYSYWKYATAADISAGSVTITIATAAAARAWMVNVPTNGQTIQVTPMSSGQGTAVTQMLVSNFSLGDGLILAFGANNTAQGSYSPISGGVWSYTQDLTNPASILGVGAPTGASQVFQVNYPTSGNYIAMGLKIQFVGMNLWTPSTAVPAWVQVKDAAPFDTFLVDFELDYAPSAGGVAQARMVFDIGVGAAGSEVPIYRGQFQIPNSATSGQNGFWIPPTSIPLAIKAGQRVAWRGSGKNNVEGPLSTVQYPNVRLAFAGV